MQKKKFMIFYYCITVMSFLGTFRKHFVIVSQSLPTLMNIISKLAVFVHSNEYYQQIVKVQKKVAIIKNFLTKMVFSRAAIRSTPDPSFTRRWRRPRSRPWPSQTGPRSSRSTRRRSKQKNYCRQKSDTKEQFLTIR